MGLGSKIKEALHGDKDKNNLGSQRRRAPETYPKRAETPRSNTLNTTATWETAPTHTDDPSDDLTVKDDKYEYTHNRGQSTQAARPGQMDDDGVSEPDYDDVTPNVTSAGQATQQQQQQQKPPYWGDFDRRNAPDYIAQDHNATRLPGAGAGTQGEDHQYRNRAASPVAQSYGTGHDQGRNDAAASAAQPGKRSIDVGARGTVVNQGEVHRSQPVVVDDDDTRARSLAVSQLWQQGPGSEHHGVDNAAYGQNGNAAYGQNGNAAYGQTGNAAHGGYATTTDAYSTSLPMRNRSVKHGQETPFGRTDNGEPYYQGATYVGQTNGQLSRQPGSDRERPSPVFGSENGSATNRAANPDHFGPGHVGAKVVHRCEHCGNDNDITRYFKKDVVYRLS